MAHAAGGRNGLGGRASRRAAIGLLVGLVALAASIGPAAEPIRAAACAPTTVAVPVTADSWLDENSPTSAKGSDSVLSVDAGTVNPDTGEQSGRARALVRFALPAAVPDGCVVESARLYLFSSEETPGTRVEAVRVAGTWSEDSVTWSTRPDTVGMASQSWSREGFMRWTVTAQVQAMIDGTNRGFLFRDAAEGAEVGGGHAFYSREKGDGGTEAHITIRFAAPDSGGQLGPPLPPEPAAVRCGQVIVRSTLITNDLSNCPGDGLVIGARAVILDLGGHSIDGVGLAVGIRNDGHASVTIRNGSVMEFDYGVQLGPETTLNRVERLRLGANQVAAIELFDVSATEIVANTLDANAEGIQLVSGTRDSVVADSIVTGVGGAGILLRDASGNRIVRNLVAGGGDLGIGLERATGNSLIGNVATGNSDGGIEVMDGSHDNQVEGNNVTDSGDHGILVSASDRTLIVGNVTRRMSDSGITLDAANDGVVRGNDVRFGSGGLQFDGSSRNRIEANAVADTTGIGIELGGGSLQNLLATNTVARNGSDGIYLADDTTDTFGDPAPGLRNTLRANIASGNAAGGIVVAKGSHAVTGNVARDNGGWGIHAAAEATDGGGNVAFGNGEPAQCSGVVCADSIPPPDVTPPQTTIVSGPEGSSGKASATFGFRSTEAGSTFRCSLDGATYRPCTSPKRYTNLRPGKHTFRVRATDAAGNTDATPAMRRWTVIRGG